MGTNAHLPANDKVTVSCDYFLSGDANKVQTTVGAAGTYAASGNPTLGAQATDPVGKGQLSGSYNGDDGTGYRTGSLSPVTTIAIGADAEKVPNSFYVWNLTMATDNHGTLTYVENPQMVAGAYKDTNTNRGYLGDYGITVSQAAAESDKELAYIYLDVPTGNDVVFLGDTNFDGTVDIRDVVFLGGDNIYKDIRTFDKDQDGFKSIADYEFVRDQIWRS